MIGSIKEKDVISAVLQHLNFDGFRRIDGKFSWKGEEWIFVAYQVNQPVQLVRIDIRKKAKKDKPSKEL